MAFLELSLPTFDFSFDGAHLFPNAPVDVPDAIPLVGCNEVLLTDRFAFS